MPRRWGSGPDELQQPRFVQFPKKVDDWLHDRAESERRSLAWVIRELVVEAYDETTAPPARRKAAG